MIPEAGRGDEALVLPRGEAAGMPPAHRGWSWEPLMCHGVTSIHPMLLLEAEAEVFEYADCNIGAICVNLTPFLILSM